MNAPLKASTLNEVHYYLMVTPCPSCSKGPLGLSFLPEGIRPGQPFAVKAACAGCSVASEFHFTTDHELPADPIGSQTINPAPSPSRLIDLAQWLSLFHMMLQVASAQAGRADTRRQGYQAALCMAEALKFYDDNELPPESAFFHASTLETFGQHPEKFARQRLRDMQAKLPTLGKMAGRLSKDCPERPLRKWWQFWR